MKKLFVFLLAAVMVFTLCGCSAAGSGENVIILGTSADYAPFEFHILEDGEDKIVGIDVSVAYQIAEDMDKELQIADMNFDNLLTLMAQGECDMVIAAMEQSPERLEQASCSDPYYTDLPAMIVVKKADLDKFHSLEDFNGVTVGAQSGTTKADIVMNDMPGAVPNLMTNVGDLINNLVYDKCQAVVLDGAVALQYVEANEDLAIVEAVPLGEALPYCVWVEKGDPKNLLPSINETIAKINEQGLMDTYITEADELSDKAME